MPTAPLAIVLFGIAFGGADRLFEAASSSPVSEAVQAAYAPLRGATKPVQAGRLLCAEPVHDFGVRDESHETSQDPKCRKQSPIKRI